MFSPKRPSALFFALWLGLLFVLALTTIAIKKSGRKLFAELVIDVILILVMSALVACGGGGGGSKNPGTPAGTYTVTVTGSSNQLQHSTTVTLNVQ